MIRMGRRERGTVDGSGKSECGRLKLKNEGGKMRRLEGEKL